MKEDVDKTRALGLPASVILIDSPWTTSYNSYKFNPKQFDDAAGDGEVCARRRLQAGAVAYAVDQFAVESSRERRGLRGKIAPHAENYDEAAGNGYFVKNAGWHSVCGAVVEGDGVDDRLHESYGEALVAGSGAAGDRMRVRMGSRMTMRRELFRAM